MTQFEKITEFFKNDVLEFYWPEVHPTDIVELIILSFLIYQLIIWIKNTRAWTLLKGIVVIGVFVILAFIFKLNTILWIASKTINVGIIAIVIIFQPELRKALEQLGRKNILTNIISFDDGKETDANFTDKTINELVRACFELGKTKTGALIVIEQNTPLAEFERTGIPIDAIVTSQLLINIFEHNTPLHDGAVIVRNNRVVSATCYLPLTESMELSKELGTRHRAGVGISEVSDSVTLIVSEETGKVSVAAGGKLVRNVDGDYLKKRLSELQKKGGDTRKFRRLRGRLKNEKENIQ
ncbi:diadenylate cyclase CdaA [Falcatimonas sp. MSJ-15]|uniref:diadenylate cyclase CdaA n=1 Tax=Falcatimonas sp. MSJ-15 TaxID=2841515 RepID=UPI001C11C537|nr:diadenylate cyclase CdaA [Falcatimonas sp. MSJ-15]MBU5470959.1 diadenylate cyclase CdaA [Falcatimonas sp. MSJ-15]